MGVFTGYDLMYKDDMYRCSVSSITVRAPCGVSTGYDLMYKDDIYRCSVSSNTIRAPCGT